MSQCIPLINCSINVSNVLGALQIPNGKTLNFFNLLHVEKAVLTASFGFIGTWWYALPMSSVQKYFAPDNASRQEFMCGKCWAELTVHRLWNKALLKSDTLSFLKCSLKQYLFHESFQCKWTCCGYMHYRHVYIILYYSEP